MGMAFVSLEEKNDNTSKLFIANPFLGSCCFHSFILVVIPDVVACLKHMLGLSR